VPEPDPVSLARICLDAGAHSITVHLREDRRHIQDADVLQLGRECRHFSFPYGDAGSAGPRDFEIARELGLKTAVTTQKGLIHAKHGKSLTSLPRLSLNGDFQHPRYVKVMLSGAPFAIYNLAQKMTFRQQSASSG
jgi:peptidoglycan/xylan/chitin deacetylase (PgdA/CDA1 family)